MNEARITIDLPLILKMIALPGPRITQLLDEWAQLACPLECVLAGLELSPPPSFSFTYSKPIRLPASTRIPIRDLYKSPAFRSAWVGWWEEQTELRRLDQSTVLGLIVWSAIRDGVGEVASDVRRMLSDALGREAAAAEAAREPRQIERPLLEPVDDCDLPGEEWWRRMDDQEGYGRAV